MDVESRFNHTFLLDKFPLDSHKLSILLEDTSHGLNQIFYVIDYKNSGYGTRLNLPGWLLNNWNAEILSHDYGTSFGDDKGVAGGSIYSTARFDINISRPVSYFYWKLLLPLTIVLCGAWIVLLLEPSQIEVRTGLPATALLTTVFLQQSYSDHLPQVGYLVLMSHLQNYQPENSASQYQLPKSHFFNRAERESLFLAHDPIISSFLSKPGHNCPFNS